VNAASAWRLEAARELGRRYGGLSGVTAIMVASSTARGDADRYSDLDLVVLWEETPARDRREAALADLPGDLVRLYDFDAEWKSWSDALTLGRAASGERFTGLACDVTHMLVADARAFLDALERDHTTADPPHNFASLLTGARALSGAELIRSWQDGLRYPDPLAVAMVTKHAQIEYFWSWRSALERAENMMLVQHNFVCRAQQLLRALLALNRAYFRGFGHLDWVFAQLQLAPDAFETRFRALWSEPPAALAAALSALIEESYDCIEQNLPGVDVARLRRFFHHTRTPWDEPPPGLP
jgi:predicted nucleotidyltransferase